MHINSAIGYERVVTPDMIDNLIAGIDPAGMARQKEEKLQFRRA